MRRGNFIVQDKIKIKALLKRLDLYVNARPFKAMPLSKSPIDLVIVRGNTDYLYVKEERTFDGADSQGKVIEAVKRISDTRIAALAGELALRWQKRRDEGIHCIRAMCSTR